jgi:pimeloyl-ACP methyl ester carboxylesterase
LIPGTGHALYLEKPQASNRLVRDLAMQHTESIGVSAPID